MKKNELLLVISYLLVSLILSACGPTSSQAQNSEGVNGIEGQPTIAVMRTLDLSTLPPTVPPPPTPTSLPPTPTQEIPPTEIEATAAEVLPESTATTACTNQAELVQHLSIPPHTSIKNGAVFNKIWRIKNVGTCIWTTNYSLEFVSGDQQLLYSQTSIPFSVEVKPGETVDLSVYLIAPEDLKEFSANWMIKDEAGNMFGVGVSGDEPLLVTILVDKWKDYIPASG